MAAITVLMPVYNSEKYLAEAIDSILNQTFQDFEFLIIDDGSTDSSLDIMHSYKDPRLRIYQNEQNSGISPTLNKGIQLAQAELIARMDADDICYPTRLEKQYAYMQTHPDCGMVSSLVRVISETGEEVRKDKFESRFFYYNLNFICWIYHSTVLYRKKAVIEAGMYSVPYAEDFELFWQIARQHKIYNLPEVLLDYRITSQSLNQVLKKNEYDKAQKEQLIRNFRYFVGEHYTLSEKYLSCFQHNFTPLLEEQKVESLVDCLRELDFINHHILSKNNINRDVEAMKEAAFHKKEFIIVNMALKLSRSKCILFLLKIKRFQLLSRLIVFHILHKFKIYNHSNN